ncbi:unnamed protein product [Prunus armeniaca]
MELQGQHALEGLELGPACAELKEMKALGFGAEAWRCSALGATWACARQAGFTSWS